MPKITRKTRWTAQELKEHYSKPLSRFYSPKQRQQHNLFAKYVNEGKLTNKAVIRDNAVYLGRGVRTQQVITGLHPNVPGTVKTAKLGRVEAKASDSANSIPSSYLADKKFFSSGDYYQSSGQHNVMRFNPKTQQMVVGYQNRKGKTSVYLYNNVPAKVQYNLMYDIDNKLPKLNEYGEKTQGINTEWQKKYRDTFSAGIKINYPNKKDEVEDIKNSRNADMWGEGSFKVHPAHVKSVERWNQEAREQEKELRRRREKTEKYLGGNNE